MENKFKDVIEDKRKIGVQVIAYSGKFQEYIVFPSMASASKKKKKTVKQLNSYFLGHHPVFSFFLYIIYIYKYIYII